MESIFGAIFNHCFENKVDGSIPIFIHHSMNDSLGEFRLDVSIRLYDFEWWILPPKKYSALNLVQVSFCIINKRLFNSWNWQAEMAPKKLKSGKHHKKMRWLNLATKNIVTTSCRVWKLNIQEWIQGCSWNTMNKHGICSMQMQHM